MLIQFAEKHNLRIAFDLKEDLHINRCYNNLEGTEVETTKLDKGHPFFAQIKQWTLDDATLSGGFYACAFVNLC